MRPEVRQEVKEVIQYETPGEIACFIAEPIQGVGGVVHPPAKSEYFKIVYDIVRQHGGLCIADEVQGGFGRTGDHFWAHRELGRDARRGDDGQGARQRGADRRDGATRRDLGDARRTACTSTRSAAIRSA